MTNNFYKSGSYYGSFRTRTFIEIFEDFDSFKEDYSTCGIPAVINDTNLQTLYYLLYARYGNSHISNSDEMQFKMRLFSIIFTDGVRWEKRLEAQNKLAALTDAEILNGNKTIYNHALNPGDGADAGDELDYINDQDVSIINRSKISAYEHYYEVFKNCTDDFIDKFKRLFIVIIAPDSPLLYETELEDING